MLDLALKALHEQRWRTAAARYAERLLRDPADSIARTNRAVALYEAGRYPEAARAFEDLVRREGAFSEVTPPALFSLGFCRLELDDARGALTATTLFLELSNDAHPFYWDGVQNLACALSRLDEPALSARLYRTVLGARPHTSAYNGLALALGDLGRAPEGLYVLDTARRSGRWDEVLAGSHRHLIALAGGRRKRTQLIARPWTRGRILRTAFRILVWRRTPVPPSVLEWRRSS